MKLNQIWGGPVPLPRKVYGTAPLWEGVATPTPEMGHSGSTLLSQIEFILVPKLEALVPLVFLDFVQAMPASLWHLLSCIVVRSMMAVPRGQALLSSAARQCVAKRPGLLVLCLFQCINGDNMQ